MFKKPFSFKGRIRRTEYCLSYIIYMVVASIINVLVEEVGGLATILFFTLLIGLFWFMIAQGAKRCHDRGNTGWYQIIPFYFLWMLFADSDHGENRYGLNPKNIGNENEIDEIGKPVGQE